MIQLLMQIFPVNRIIPGVLFALLAFPALAQDFEVPVYKFDKKEDYSKYEKDVVACVSWLEHTAPDTLVKKRKYASAFLTAWVEGSPSVSIILRTYVQNLTDNNPDMITLFMGAWARYQLNNRNDKEETHASLAAVKCIVSYYEQNKRHGLAKDNDLEKLVGMNDAELREWIAKSMDE